MSRNYKFHNPAGLYFVSFATVYWLDVFVREKYFITMVESLSYCCKNKGMALYAYCIMPSHVHLIFRAKQGNPSGLIGDLKNYTSKLLQQLIEENPEESRKEWFFFMMERAGKKSSNVINRQFWQHDNHPIELWSNQVIQEKLDYIHGNPVDAGFVANKVDWKYSSDRNFMDGSGVIKLDKL